MKDKKREDLLEIFDGDDKLEKYLGDGKSRSHDRMALVIGGSVNLELMVYFEIPG